MNDTKTIERKGTTMTTKIGKNRTRKIAEVFAAAKFCTRHDLDNYFEGAECRIGQANELLFDCRRAWLSDDGGGQHTVHVHSNLFFRVYDQVQFAAAAC